MRVQVTRLLGILTLAVLGLTFASALSVSAATPPEGRQAAGALVSTRGFEQYTPGPSTPAGSSSTAIATPAGQTGSDQTAPDDCWLWDSWCAYCTNYPDASPCKAYPPGHRTASGGASTGSTQPAQTTAPAASPASSTTVLVAQNATLGRILTDAQRMTLYTFTKDMAGVSTCNGQCATTWPPMRPPSGALTLPSGATGKLAVISRDDGTQQVTYNGMPLYRYSKDMAPGDTNGQGVAGSWFAATP